MFSLLVRSHARPLLAAFSTATRPIPILPASHSVYFRIEGLPRHADIKEQLSAYGTLADLVQAIPYKPGSFFAQFEQEAAAKRALDPEADLLPGVLETAAEPFDDYIAVRAERKVRRPSARPKAAKKSARVVMRHIPTWRGCTTQDVAEMVKPFGSASISQCALFTRAAVRSLARSLALIVFVFLVTGHNDDGYAFDYATITFRDEDAAEKFVDACFTGEGVYLHGERVYATYVTIDRGDDGPKNTGELPRPYSVFWMLS